jgi:hypothetical protein
LGTGWHAGWLLVGVVLSVVLVGFPAVASISGGWPTNVDPQFDFTNAWRTVALASFAVTFAVGGSLFKKVHYAKLVARRGDAVRKDSTRAGVWAAVTSRWRLDIWVAAFGGFIIGFAGVVPSLVDWGGDPDAGSAVVFMGILVIVGGLVFVAGLVLSANFWRAGRPPGYAESAS